MFVSECTHFHLSMVGTYRSWFRRSYFNSLYDYYIANTKIVILIYYNNSHIDTIRLALQYARPRPRSCVLIYYTINICVYRVNEHIKDNDKTIF